VCKKLIKNSQPFGKNFQKTAGWDFFGLTLYNKITSTRSVNISFLTMHNAIEQTMYSAIPGRQHKSHELQ